MAASLHGDIASAIGQQVEQMILQAKKDSEARVKHDLSVARSQLGQMDGMVAELTDRVARAARAGGGAGGPDAPTVDRAFLTQKVAQLEQKWGAEVKALKQDLHRTILAHNHNSDLIRHHRDALDQARKRLDAQAQPKPEQVDAQMDKVERMLRAGQAKQRALDALTERLALLEAQVAEAFPAAGLPSSFLGGLPGQQPGGGAAAGARPKGGKEEPTDDEIRQRMLQASRAAGAGAADGAGSFNADAPEFVPRGASPSDAAAEVGDGAETNGESVVATAVAAAASTEPAEGGKSEPAAAEEQAEVVGESADKPTDEVEKPPKEDAKPEE